MECTKVNCPMHAGTKTDNCGENCPWRTATKKGDLISREEAIAWFFRPYSNEESYSNLDVERALKAIPTVDAAPMRDVIPVEWLREKMNMADDAGDIDSADLINWLIHTWHKEQEAR